MTVKYFQQSLLETSPFGKAQGPVKCLGIVFESDDKRREFFSQKLQEKLKDPEFRKIAGFPMGSDEDILYLSDPPYYTACPNPFVEDFVRCYGKPYNPEESYNREPFAFDVSEGKTNSLYKAHSYHTKVPHLAIVPFILHYTEPGDLVLDGFCGSGMTAVAASWCGVAPESYRQELQVQWEREGLDKPQWGPRRTVLTDLAPAATCIAANYNLPFDVDTFATAGRQLLDEVEKELGWMYETLHTDDRTKGRIGFTVWSEVFACPDCAGEIIFTDEALDKESKRVRECFPCPYCGANLKKDTLERIYESGVDPATGDPWRRVKFRPCLISYLVSGNRYEKEPEEGDLKLLERIGQLPLPSGMPTNRLPVEEMYHGSRIAPKGITHVHHFFLPRAAHAMAALWRKAGSYPDPRIRHMLQFFVDQAVWGISLLNRYSPTHFSNVNRYLTGVYYIGSQHSECSPWYILDGKLDRLVAAFRGKVAALGSTIIGTATSSHLELPDNCVDYIFTDPPFGENIYYADLNFLVESWYRVSTDANPEAIVDKFKKKGLLEYQQLMQHCFEEYFRVLKPGRWMTVVFHNSRNAVWNAIQESVLAAGFVVADIRTLDKQQGSYRQVTSTAVKQDLVISAYKPNGGLEERFKLEAGTEEGVWDFTRTHLKQLPTFVAKDGRAEIIAERQSHLLFDRMVAFHILRGITVPLSAAEFYQGLAQRFPERDGMYFLPDQATEYDMKRITVTDIVQLKLLVLDEASAIQWLKQQLTQKPQTFQELHPKFFKEISGWEKHEKPLELSELLEQNFLVLDVKDFIPAQLVICLKQSEKLRTIISTELAAGRSVESNGKLYTQNQELLAAAKDHWYVPDPNQAGDLERLRERALLREFDEYKASSQRRLKVFRLEAVRAGFKKSWQERDYQTIIAVASKISESILQEDPKLLMWYDQALTRSGEG